MTCQHLLSRVLIVFTLTLWIGCAAEGTSNDTDDTIDASTRDDLAMDAITDTSIDSSMDADDLSSDIAADAPSDLDMVGPDSSDTMDMIDPDIDMADTDMDMPPIGPMDPILYPSDRTLSPITPFVAANMQAIAARDAKRQADVFAKVGDSITVSPNFMRCFAGTQVMLDTHSDLQPSIDAFTQGLAETTNPFERDTLAAMVGWSSGAPLSGMPSALEQELNAIQPRFAVVMLGSNDIGSDPASSNIYNFANNLLTLTDNLTDQGIIPVLSSVPPRNDNMDADALVPRFNAVIRGIAQARQVPFVDYHRELLSITNRGLSADGLHPNVYAPAGIPRGCDLTPTGLDFGYNVRNLVTLQSLDRMRRVVVDGVTSLDGDAPTLRGVGTFEDPFEIETLPFSDVRDTSQGGTQRLNQYSGCNASQDESGPEFMYRLMIDRETTVRAWVFDDSMVDIDLHLIDSTGTEMGCLQRNDRTITATLSPGTYFISLDTFVSSGNERRGEYLFVLLEE